MTGRNGQSRSSISTPTKSADYHKQFGSFTFKVKPGKYRVQVALRAGKSIIRQPGVMMVNRSEVDARRLIIGTVRLLRPRYRATTTPVDPALGFPLG